MNLSRLRGLPRLLTGRSPVKACFACLLRKLSRNSHECYDHLRNEDGSNTSRMKTELEKEARTARILGTSLRVTNPTQMRVEGG